MGPSWSVPGALQEGPGPRSVQWHLESVVDPGGPVRGRDHQRQLDDLFLAEMSAELLQVSRLDIFRAGGQEVRIPQDCPLLRGKQAGMGLSTRFLQRVDLFVGQPVPLTRSGVRTSSKTAAIQDRSPQVGKVLELGSECPVGPDRGMQLIEGPQGIRFMRQYLEVRSDRA